MRLQEIDKEEAQSKGRRAAELVDLLYRKHNMWVDWKNVEPKLTELVKPLYNKFLEELAAEAAQSKDADLFNHYAERWLETDLSDIFSNKSEMSMVNDMLNNPDYWREEKGYEWKLVHMPPYRYAIMSKAGFGTWNEFSPEDHLITEYERKVLDGSKMPLVYLKHTLMKNGEVGFTQEGRHRAIVADRLGAKSMPVLIIVNADSWELYGTPEFEEFKKKIWAKYSTE